jgi:ABC-2 type transport system permease protein
MTLIKYVFEADLGVFQRIGSPMVGIFPLVSMFLVTSVAMLRERRSGTLERLMTMPLAKLDLLVGYGIAFGIVGVAQGVVVTLVSVKLLGLTVAGPIPIVVVVATANALLGMALGLLLSAFASTEFQAVQFLPAVILPQFFLCGLLTPRSEMAQPLRVVSYVMPLTYAYDALHRLSLSKSLGTTFWFDLCITVSASIIALGLGAATLRRRTP